MTPFLESLIEDKTFWNTNQLESAVFLMEINMDLMFFFFNLVMKCFFLASRDNLEPTPKELTLCTTLNAIVLSKTKQLTTNTKRKKSGSYMYMYMLGFLFLGVEKQKRKQKQQNKTCPVVRAE